MKTNEGPISKRDFWDKVIRVGPHETRLVAKTDLNAKLPEDDPEENFGSYSSPKKRQIEAKVPFKLWVPATPEDDFNLVLSLCTDGCHRPVVDLDFPKDKLSFKDDSSLSRVLMYVDDGRGGRQQIIFKGAVVVFPSTNFAHLYTDVPMTFSEYTDLLGEIPGEDASAYRTNTVNAGFGALRPPWVKKGDSSNGPSGGEFDPVTPGGLRQSEIDRMLNSNRIPGRFQAVEPYAQEYYRKEPLSFRGMEWKIQ